MPTVARRRSSHAAVVDPSTATPQKRSLRSDSGSPVVAPVRKSPRLCSREGGGSPPKVEVIEKSLKCSLNFKSSSPEKRIPENDMEKPIWDPKDLDQLRAVKEALHVSTAPNYVMCRELEQRTILDFCKKCVKEEKAGSLYLCGCPGTGKSLSMEKVKEALVDWANEDGVQSPDMLSINCTSLTNTTAIFNKILEQSHPQRKPDRSTSALQILQRMYSEKQPDGMKMMLIIADELDYLITKDRAVLHDLFMLTTMPFSKCILIGIANAIDLADRFIPKLKSLNCKPTVITFRAYSKDEIKAILEERLRDLPYVVFQPQAMELCARKVASASGDMRKALSVCRSAIEMFEAEKRDTIINNSNLPLLERNGDQQNPSPCHETTNQANNMVRIDHVAASLSKTFKSPVVDTIQSLPQHQQIILCSAAKLFRGGKKDTTLGELNKHYVDVCKSTLIPPVGITELSSMCRVLDDQGILKLGQSREDKLRRVALKVDEADIVFALQRVRFFRNCLQ
ncbi:cell division control protein 6 homolog B-like [Andrographis paniculata]|uniref:cell division control protein 6 homolog B-like n=1 Tax=Andrographis paniculata TaxID=175694 RepID=UPI0021E748DD|nr:cell division control protein 6 homolog B-like [Andrographis paniculata]